MKLNVALDFDGVILNSNQLKLEAFVKLLTFDCELARESYRTFLKEQHFLHRSEKFRHYYRQYTSFDAEEVEIEVSKKSTEFSSYILSELVKTEYRIEETIDFLLANSAKYNFYIVSSASRNDLVKLCEAHGIFSVFIDIFGGERSKNEWLGELSQKCDKDSIVFIGDAESDLQAASLTGVRFIGFNNESLKNKSIYLETFNSFDYLIKGV